MEPAPMEWVSPAGAVITTAPSFNAAGSFEPARYAPTREIGPATGYAQPQSNSSSSIGHTSFPPIDQAEVTRPATVAATIARPQPWSPGSMPNGSSLLYSSAIPLESPDDSAIMHTAAYASGLQIAPGPIGNPGIETPASIIQSYPDASMMIQADSTAPGDQGANDRFPWREHLRPRFGSDQGIGFERVMFAPNALDTAISSSNVGVRFTSARGLGTPDRAEYFWRSGSRGPGNESRVDVMNTQFRSELGNELGAAIMELNMRALNPTVNDNTIGFGDIAVGAKATLFNGRCTKVATIFRSYFATGPTDNGLGTGHISLEPGLLLRHQTSERTYWHGEMKYWLPLGGTPGIAGDVLKTGAGVSTIWRDSDRLAVLPTFEVQTLTFLFGGATDPSGIRHRVNGDTAVELIPGARWVLGPGGGLGLWELGTAGAFSIADRDWFDTRLMIDLRLVR
ncbi:MAG: hypothetical protein U0892_14390 [Pirellulales bacterium]